MAERGGTNRQQRDRAGAQLAIRSGILDWVEHLEQHIDNVLRILVYHRVDWPDAHQSDLDPTLLSVTPDAFAQQMEYIAHHYCVISAAQLVEALDGGQHLPPKAVMVTFDDGYRDFYTYAWPVLQRLRLPSVLFVATDYLDGQQRTMWWDRLFHAITCTDRDHLDLQSQGSWRFVDTATRFVAFQSIKQVLVHMEHHQAMELLEQICRQLDVAQPQYCGLLTWEEVRHLTGVSICAHTCSHPVLSRVTQAAAWHEIADSYVILQHHLGETQPIFAYPCGRAEDLSPSLFPLLAAAGFRAAVTTFAGHNHLPHGNRWQLRRAGLAPHISLDEYRLVLTSSYSLYGLMAQLLRRWQSG